MSDHHNLHNDVAISSPKRTRSIMQKFAITTKKSLGQNFLIDNNIIRKIIEAADLNAQHGVVEIGPGIGSLTEQLAMTAKKVVAVEIDRHLIPVLQSTLSSLENVEVVHGDVLQLNLSELLKQHFEPGQNISVVANLPYYITTPIIMKLLEEQLPLDHIVVMIQKEVAERLTASPGSKQYGSLTVAIRYYTEPEIVMTIPKTVFIPQPNVESAVIRLKKRDEPPVKVDDEALFFALVQGSFAQRRKTLVNNLLNANLFDGQEDSKESKKTRIQSLLETVHIEPTRRAETLSIDEFAMLSNEISRLKK